MCNSGHDTQLRFVSGSSFRSHSRGLTLVELAIVLGLSGILAMTIPPLVLQGTQVFVFLPKSQWVNQAGLEILHACIEGSHSSLTSQTLYGLRFAANQSSPPEPAIWLAEAERIGFLLPHDLSTPVDNQYVVIHRSGELILRGVYPSNTCPPPATTEEVIPYEAQGTVRVLDLPSGSLFRYYDQGGTELLPPGCLAASSGIRRVNIAFAVQTGSGDFEQSEGQIELSSSVAVRFP